MKLDQISEAYIDMLTEGKEFDTTLNPHEWYHQMTVGGKDRQYYNVSTSKPKMNEIIHVNKDEGTWAHKKHGKLIQSGSGSESLKNYLKT
jgi:hypothetical protein